MVKILAATNGGFPATSGFTRSGIHQYDNKNNRQLENGSGIYVQSERTRRYLTHLAMLAAALLVGPLQAFAQTPNIVGTWVLTAADKLLPDGTRTSDYGENPTVRYLHCRWPLRC